MIHIITKVIDEDCPEYLTYEVLEGPPDVDLTALVAEYARLNPPVRHDENMVDDLDLLGLVNWLCGMGFRRVEWAEPVAVSNFSTPGGGMANQVWREPSTRHRMGTKSVVLADKSASIRR